MSSYTSPFKLSILGGEQQSSTGLADKPPETNPPPQSPASLTNIVVVHGLNGGNEVTWTMPSGELWLKAMALEVPHSRFMTFGYSPYVNEVGWEVFSPLGIWTVAVELLQSLLKDSREDKLDDRRYIFIAQGYGGFVIKQALLIAHHQHTYLPIARRTLGLVSFGTPNSSNFRPSDDRVLWKRNIFNMIVPFDDESMNNQDPFSLPQISTSANCEYWLEICETFQQVSKKYNIIDISTRVKTGTFASGKTDPGETPTISASDHWPTRDGSYISLSRFSGADDKDFLRLSKELNKMIERSEALDLDSLYFIQRLASINREPPPPNILPHSGIFNWIWNDENFLQWSKEDVNGVLHLRGSAGQGQTALCAYLHKGIQEKSGATVLSFFYHNKDDNYVRFTMISMVWKLLYFEPALYAHFAEKLKILSESSMWTHTEEDLWEFLRKLLLHPRERPLICIFDSLDDFGGDHLTSGKSGWLLERLVRLQKQTSLPFSLVISSECSMDGSTAPISLGTVFVIDLDTVTENSRDVERVFQHCLSS